jgi:hypothetical protein
MPNDNFDEFVIQIKLETDKIRGDLNNLSKELSKSAETISDKFSNAFNSNKLQRDLAKNTDLIKTATLNITRILTGGLTGLGGILGANFAIDFVKNMTSQAHTMEGAADAYNTNPKKLQLLQEVYKRFGGTPEEANSQVAQLYQRLNTYPIDPSLAQGVTALNINTKGKDTVDIILEALKKIGNGGYDSGQRQTLLNGFGLASLPGNAAVNKPNQLTENIQRAQADLIPDDQRKQLAELDKRFQHVAESWKRIQANILTDIMPAIELFTAITEKITKIFSSDNNKSKYNLDSIDGVNSPRKSNAEIEKIVNNLKKSKNQFQNNDSIDAFIHDFIHSEDSINNQKNNIENNTDNNENKMVPALKPIPEDKLLSEPPIILRERKMEDHQKYMDKIQQSRFSMPNSINNTHSAINHNQQTSYNIDNIHLPSVTNPTQFATEMEMLRNVGYSSGRNQLA